MRFVIQLSTQHVCHLSSPKSFLLAVSGVHFARTILGSTVGSPSSHSSPTMPDTHPSPAHVLSHHVHETALLNSHCYDITLSAFGRLYKLHRIFLVQSSFFSALLQGGFSEGEAYTVPCPLSTTSPTSTLHLTFDDPNITRPAFEYCVAHLYGSAPQLVLPHWAIATPAAPLSNAWPPTHDHHGHEAHTHVSAATQHVTQLKPGNTESMPATPRFLLSLLATSIYLGIPALTSAATTLIMASFTPFTLSTYLSFALGKPILGAAEARKREYERGTQSSHDGHLWDWELEGPCWGLDHIGIPHPLDDADISSSSSASTSHHQQRPDLDEDDQISNDGGSSLHTRDRTASSSPSTPRRTTQQQQQHQRPSMSRANTTATSSTSPHLAAAPLLDYGQISHQIAESAFCYLHRWAADIAAVEEEKWEYDQAALEDWLIEVQQGGQAAHADTVLLSQAITSYLLPKGQVPAKVVAPGGVGVEATASPSRRPKSTPAPNPQWAIPTPALCIFSHPYFSKAPVSARSVGRVPDTHGDGDYDDDVHATHQPPLRRKLSIDGDDDVQPIGTAHTSTAASHNIDSFAQSTRALSLGLPSNHLVALLSSDGLFVRNELHRYQLSRGIVMMRRVQKALAIEVEQWSHESRNALPRPASPPVPLASTDDDDAQYAALFKSGIYYSHLSFGHLQQISQEAQQYALAEATSVPDASSDDGEDQGSASEMDWSEDSSGSSDEENAGQEADDQSYDSITRSYLDSGTGKSTRRSRRRRNQRRIDAKVAATQDMLAPTDTLQAALWSGNEFKNHVLSSNSSASSSAGFGPTSPSAGQDAESSRRGLAFVADGSVLNADAPAAVPTINSIGVRDRRGSTSTSGHAAPAMTSSPSAASDRDRDETFLGLTSSLKQFGAAYQQATRRASSAAAAKGPQSPRWARSSVNKAGAHTVDGHFPPSPLRNKRSDTAMGSSPAASTSSMPLALGGLAHSPLASSGKTSSLLSSGSSLAPSSAAKSLFNNRYFSASVDDTVRYGEFFAGLLSPPEKDRRQDKEKTTEAPEDNVAHPSMSKFEATGLAALQDGHSICSEDSSSGSESKRNPACLGDAPVFSRVDGFVVGGAFSDAKRSADNLYGLRNKACRGRDLGRLGCEVSQRKAALDSVLASIARTRSPQDDSMDATNQHQQDEEGNEGKSTGITSVSSCDTTNQAVEEETLDAGITLAALEQRKWTGFEPMRIGVEYYGIDRLEEKQRLYSPSFFYAGSVWILYVQIMKRQKGTQLGVYLHRHGPFEPLPPRSVPQSEVERFYRTDRGGDGDDATSSSNEQRQDSLSASAPTHTSSFLHTTDRSPGASNTRRTTNATTGSSAPATSIDAQLSTLSLSSTNANTSASAAAAAAAAPPPPPPPTSGPPVLPGQSPHIPYRDPRKSVRAFFSIHCYSPLGNSLTRFDSGPDKFSESQSWGWKSSSLMGVWTLPTGKREEGRSERCERFRCVVRLGVI